MSKEVRESNSVSSWKSIKGVWESLSCFIFFKIRKSSKGQFWYDLWCGGDTLKKGFWVYSV